MVDVIPVSPGSVNLLFVDQRMVTKANIHDVLEDLGRRVRVNYAAVIMVNGDPHKAAKMITTEELMPLMEAKVPAEWSNRAPAEGEKCPNCGVGILRTDFNTFYLVCTANRTHVYNSLGESVR